MPLEQLNLDTLTWAEMVTTIRGRIPAASAGEWTLHAPVDPGVTLLELFAYLLEQRVYWLDQIPDSLVYAALQVLGETVHTATAASTVMRFSPRDFENLNRLSELRLVGSVPPLIFSLNEDLLLLPCAEFSPTRYRIGLQIGSTDRSVDLINEREICLLPALSPSGEIKIVLYLTSPIPNAGNAFGDWFAFFFDLLTPQEISPQWYANAQPNIPPPSTLTWLYPNATSGNLEAFPNDAVEDGTAGMRRSGVVRLKLPRDWQAEPPDPALPGLSAYPLVVRFAQSTFTSPPVVKRIVPNAALAKHRRRTTKHNLKVDWLPLPGNALALTDLYTQPPAGSGLPPLQDHPVLDTQRSIAPAPLNAIDESVQLTLVEKDRPFEWKPTMTFTFSGPDERVFIVDREKGLLRFGDGITGRVPVLNRQQDPNLTVQFFAGGGEPGNIGTNSKFESVADADVTAINIVPGQGGAEPELLEDARRRVVGLLRRVERAVTEDDYVDIALKTRGIAIKRAYAALGHHPSHPCRNVPGAVTVYVVPDAPREEEDSDYDQDCAYVAAPVPDAGALNAVRSRFESARLIGSEVFVAPAQYRPVSLLVEVRGDPFDPVELNKRLRLGLQTFLDPLRGGLQKDGWPFGEPLRPSVLLNQCQRIAGQDADVVSVSIGLDCQEPSENCKDVSIEPHELVVLKSVVVRLLPEALTAGGLR